MTEALFAADAYARECEATVRSSGPEGVVLDRSVHYPRGGGQPGDAGRLEWDGGGCAVTDTVKGEGGAILHLIDGTPPPEGAVVRAILDWDRRNRHMRMHTALHLLSVAVPLPVTGGQIGADRSRLDFDMPEPFDKAVIEADLNALIDADHPVGETSITEADLDANPGLVKTLRVAPPRGAGRIRLVRIGGDDGPPVDLQPCGGTHVRSTGEIGRATVLEVKNKGRSNRRVAISLEP